MTIKQQGGIFGRNPSFNILDATTVTASGNITSSAGNIVIGTSGKGIDFSATSGTGTSELFSDYEEGSWSPVISDASTGGNLGSASISDASYTKIGRAVVLSAQLTNIDTTGMTASNILHIRGLPFVSSSGNFSVGSVKSDNLTFQGGRTNIYCHLQRSDDWLAFQVTGSAVSETYIDVGDVVSGTTDISFSITYIT